MTTAALVNMSLFCLYDDYWEFSRLREFFSLLIGTKPVHVVHSYLYFGKWVAILHLQTFRFCWTLLVEIAIWKVCFHSDTLNIGQREKCSGWVWGVQKGKPFKMRMVANNTWQSRFWAVITLTQYFWIQNEKKTSKWLRTATKLGKKDDLYNSFKLNVINFFFNYPRRWEIITANTAFYTYYFFPLPTLFQFSAQSVVSGNSR